MKAVSIQRSLSRWFALQALIGLSIVCVVVYGITRWSFQLKQAEEFDRHSDLVRHAIAETRTPPNLNALRHKLDDYFQTHPDIQVVLLAGEQQIYRSQRPVPQGHSVFKTLSLDGLKFEEAPVRLELTLDSSSDDLLLERLAWTLVAAATLGSLGVAWTGFLIVRRGLRPLKQLTAQTAAAGPTRPGARIDATSYASELHPWIEQFNALLERAEGAYAQLEAFNADVAHELRTPLANMIAQVEIELSQVRPVGALREAMSSQLEEAQRLSAIVTDMLFLSKADRGARARRGRLLSIAEQVAAVGEFHEAELEAAALSLRIDGDAVVQVDVGLLRRAVSNLLSNAIRYAKTNSLICVEIEHQDMMVRLSVVNRGDKIDPAALPRLFERFYRADISRSGSSSHHGLGLAIVAAIARMHGGKPFAESARGVTRIGFTLVRLEAEE
ncbi:heavy metal sensor histidine kinase [Variovorax sp. PAMC 28711]|uniref:heavy metal sensor histidine kinase n=1 Tax=Variovorax sp. PAMC 28711 TaxID=1795631 RepID=UPI0009EA399A|nr:heavy metal sensor histidine kinase [Variovorax sp. PAMC 28711]